MHICHEGNHRHIIFMDSFDCYHINCDDGGTYSNCDGHGGMYSYIAI